MQKPAEESFTREGALGAQENHRSTGAAASFDRDGCDAVETG